MANTFDLAETAAPTSTGEAQRLKTVLDARYTPKELLGRGGMGEVQLCYDARTDRDLAVKVTRQGLGSEGRRRFEREARLQARLEHPAFVPIYDIATSADEEPYFVMRRVRGRTLRELLESPTPLAEHRLLSAFAQLCLAVDYAHSRSVVHRDIKPDNVMLGEFGEVYLLDWGVAKALDEPELPQLPSTERGSTQAGELIGTVGYMAPEQLRGEHATLDGRADVYALGALLFELLTRQPLNPGATTAERMRVTLEPVDRSPARRSDEEVAPELDAIVLKATQPDRTQRYESARALANAVERYLEGERDIVARRTAAARLAEEARAQLGAFDPNTSAIVRAGRQASHARALDPSNAVAAQALSSVLAAALARPPPAVLAAAEDVRRDAEASAAATFGRGVLLFSPLSFAVLYLTGVRSWPLALAFLGFNLLAGALFATTKPAASQDKKLFIAFALLCAANAVGTRWVSPWVIVPMTALGNALSIGLYAKPWLRWATVLLSFASVLGPALLDELRWVSPSYELVNGQLVIHPVMGDINNTWLIFVYVALLLGVAVSVVWPTMKRMRELELHVQTSAWTMRQIVRPE